MCIRYSKKKKKYVYIFIYVKNISNDYWEESNLKQQNKWIEKNRTRISYHYLSSQQSKSS